MFNNTAINNNSLELSVQFLYINRMSTCCPRIALSIRRHAIYDFVD